jgi:molybdopterin synthase sulfur carrier subunit
VNVRVRLFAVAKQLAGRDVISLEVPQRCNVSQLRARLAVEVPALAAVLPQITFAIDSQYASDDSMIAPGSDIACIPPVSGG